MPEATCAEPGRDARDLVDAGPLRRDLRNNAEPSVPKSPRRPHCPGPRGGFSLPGRAAHSEDVAGERRPFGCPAVRRIQRTRQASCG